MLLISGAQRVAHVAICTAAWAFEPRWCKCSLSNCKAVTRSIGICCNAASHVIWNAWISDTTKACNMSNFCLLRMQPTASKRRFECSEQSLLYSMSLYQVRCLLLRPIHDTHKLYVSLCTTNIDGRYKLYPRPDPDNSFWHAIWHAYHTWSQYTAVRAWWICNDNNLAGVWWLFQCLAVFTV